MWRYSRIWMFSCVFDKGDALVGAVFHSGEGEVGNV